MNKKKLVIIAAAAAGVAAIIAVVFLLFNKEETYRQIQVYELNGTASVKREKNQTLEAYNNMQLYNEDEVNVSDNSSVQLKLDDDKYILLEEDTQILLKASGDDQDSKTMIELKKGSIINNLANKLGKNSTYEVNTPNSTMAVRGTTFRMEVHVDKNNIPHTILEVMEGTVACQLKNPDGTLNEEIVMVSKGEAVQVDSIKGNADYNFQNSSVNYENLNLDALQFLNRILANEKNKQFSIEKSQLEKMITDKNKAAISNIKNNEGETIADNQEVSIENTKTEAQATQARPVQQQTQARQTQAQLIYSTQTTVQEINIPTTLAEEPTKPVEEPTIPVQEEPTKPVEEPTTPVEKPTKPVEEPTTPVQEESTKPIEEPTTPVEKPTKPVGEPTTPVQEELTKPVEEPTTPAQEEPTKPVEEPTTPAQEEPTKPVEEPTTPAQEEPTKPVEEPTTPAEDPTTKPIEKPTQPEKQVYNVRFVYNNNEFAVLKVVENELISKPLLQPTANGHWEYDFLTPVHSDLVIQWVADTDSKTDDFIEVPKNPITIVGLKDFNGEYFGIITFIAPANYQVSTRTLNDDGTVTEWTSWASSFNMFAEKLKYLSNMQIRWKDTRTGHMTDIYVLADVINEDIHVKLEKVDKAGAYLLNTNVAYELGDGLWTVNDDGIIYKGNKKFYVSATKEYIFKEENNSL